MVLRARASAGPLVKRPDVIAKALAPGPVCIGFGDRRGLRFLRRFAALERPGYYLLKHLDIVNFGLEILRRANRAMPRHDGLKANFRHPPQDAQPLLWVAVAYPEVRLHKEQIAHKRPFFVG